MKKIFIEAHKITREIKENYPEVNYQAQFGLCVSYLFENKKEEKEMKLKGTEKQVKWAKSIKTKMQQDFSVERVRFNFLAEEVTDERLVEIYEELLKNDDAVWFIDNRDREINELVAETRNIERIREKIDINIFKDMEKEMDITAMRHMKTLEEKEKKEFRKVYSGLDGVEKELIIKMVG